MLMTEETKKALDELNRKFALSLEIEEIPPTVNNVWRHTFKGGFVRVYTTKEGKEFTRRLSQKVPKSLFLPYLGDLRAVIHLTFPTKRKCDVDNYNKVVLDALNGKVYNDDSQITELHVYKSYEKNKPKTEILIERLDKGDDNDNEQ